NPDIVFVLLAGVAFLGFVLDALFDRIRITSILPLMAIGILLVEFGVVTKGDLAAITSFIPYVSGITIAFILFSVGLEIRVGELARVFGRATAFTLGLQTATGVVLSLFAYETFGWNILLAFVFGFGLSGPSSVSVPALLKVVRMGEGLRTTLLYESVASDVLQLLVPLILIGLYQTGTYSIPSVSESLAWTIFGSAAAGIVGGIFWLWILDKLRTIAAGYTWTLTITIVLATYGLSDLIGFSAAITIFVFGLILGNSLLFDADRASVVSWRTSALRRFSYALRERFQLSTGGLDIEHIQQVHREVSFFASSFFFVYLGLLFRASGLNEVVVLVPFVLALVMLALRFAFLPLLGGYFDPDPIAGRAERTIVTFNITRGLAAAVVATVPLGLGIVIPNFLDAMFLGILYSAIVSTVGIFALYRPGFAELPPKRSRPSTTPPPSVPLTRALPVADPADTVRPPLPGPPGRSSESPGGAPGAGSRRTAPGARAPRQPGGEADRNAPETLGTISERASSVRPMNAPRAYPPARGRE
ncbi:MAG: cation:proton antiporter, partial [Thermoplasmata archaeon]